MQTDFVQGDANVVGYSRSSFDTAASFGDGPLRGARNNGAVASKHPPEQMHPMASSKRQRFRSDALDDSGLYTHNRKGTGLCFDFQLGKCDKGAQCIYAHQCNKCLDARHGGDKHGDLPVTAGRRPVGKGDKGKNKGKGKGKGKW